jgi:hypothetical protein
MNAFPINPFAFLEHTLVVQIIAKYIAILCFKPARSLGHKSSVCPVQIFPSTKRHYLFASTASVNAWQKASIIVSLIASSAACILQHSALGIHKFLHFNQVYERGDIFRRCRLVNHGFLF